VLLALNPPHITRLVVDPPALSLGKPLLLLAPDDDGGGAEIMTPAPVSPVGAAVTPPPPTPPTDDDIGHLRLPPTEEDSGVGRGMVILAEPVPSLLSPIHPQHFKEPQPHNTAALHRVASFSSSSVRAPAPAAASAALVSMEDEDDDDDDEAEEEEAGLAMEAAAAAAAAVATAAAAGAMVEDEPVAPPPPARGKKLSLSVIACLSYLSMGGLMGLLGPAIPQMARALNVAETALGGAFAARAGGYILGSALVSRIPGKCWSRLGVMGVAGVVASVLNAAMPYSGRLVVLLPICFAQGVGLAIISTLGNIVL
jgi:hypothetical protein